MTTAPANFSAVPKDTGSKNVFLILGLVCIVGFLADMLTLAIPPNPMALEWRLNFTQQLSDRAIIFFLGAALTLYSCRGSIVIRYAALVCLITGIMLPLSCVLVVRDNLVTQNQNLTRIDEQAQQLQAQVQTAQESPDLAADITLEQLRTASLQIDAQAESLNQSARTSASKSIVASAGRLIVFGIGFLGLGRVGIRLSS